MGDFYGAPIIITGGVLSSGYATSAILGHSWPYTAVMAVSPFLFLVLSGLVPKRFQTTFSYYLHGVRGTNYATVVAKRKFNYDVVRPADTSRGQGALILGRQFRDASDLAEIMGPALKVCKYTPSVIGSLGATRVHA